MAGYQDRSFSNKSIIFFLLFSFLSLLSSPSSLFGGLEGDPLESTHHQDTPSPIIMRFALSFLAVVSTAKLALGCTNLLITKGASVDSSTMVGNEELSDTKML